MLTEHVGGDHDANVKFGISKHIPPNQVGGQLEGFADLFIEEFEQAD